MLIVSILGVQCTHGATRSFAKLVASAWRIELRAEGALAVNCE
jgi:hypothetical protein